MASRGERWDRDRFVSERDERGRYEDDRYTMRGGRGREHSDERYDRRYNRAFDDDDIGRRRFHDDDPRLAPERERGPDYSRRVVIDKERDREYYRDSSPRRPAFLRRQSSLDTYDRKPLQRFYEREREEYPPPARREDVYRDEYRDDYRAPAYTPIPLPKSRGLPPPRRGAYDDIDVADPDYYGDEEFRRPPDRVREREYVRERDRRSGSRDSHTTRRTRRSHSRTSITRSTSSSSGGTTVRSEYPKKGKTRIPARLVSKRAIIDIGYPFTEEGTTIIIQRALGQEHIDALLKLSEDYKKSELEVAAARSSAGDLLEDRKEVFVPPPAPTTAPTPPAPAPIVIPPPPPPPAPVIIEAGPTRNVEIVRDNSPSRATTTTSSWDSHHHHHHDGALVIDERSRSRSRSGRDIRHEIRALERELAHRPKESDREIVRAERLPDGQLVVYEESVEQVATTHKPARIEKDKKGPPPRLLRAMLGTLT